MTQVNLRAQRALQITVTTPNTYNPMVRSLGTTRSWYEYIPEDWSEEQIIDHFKTTLQHVRNSKIDVVLHEPSGDRLEYDGLSGHFIYVCAVSEKAIDSLLKGV